MPLAQFLEEIVSAPAQVLTVHSVVAGATGWAAILVYSPTAAGCALLGALEAAVVGEILHGEAASSSMNELTSLT